jgi:hypothetical protein
MVLAFAKALLLLGAGNLAVFKSCGIGKNKLFETLYSFFLKELLGNRFPSVVSRLWRRESLDRSVS